MFDLHTHTVLSDGCLIASELVRRYAHAGYTGIALTDHVDVSNMDTVIAQIVQFCQSAQDKYGIAVVPGCELTHVSVCDMSALVNHVRSLGAQMVVVHGETIVEPVVPGTNRAAIEAGADILAHPGLIADEEVALAKERNVALEITSRAGHSLANGHVVRCARLHNVRLVYSSDCHSPENILRPDMVRAVLQGSGLVCEEIEQVLADTERLFIEKCKDGRHA